MPYVLVTSNVATSAVAVKPAMEAISKAVAGALSKPESVVMMQLTLDTPMLFAASDATVAALTDAVSTALDVPADRIFMNLDDIDRTNWAKGGNLVLAPASLPATSS